MGADPNVTDKTEYRRLASLVLIDVCLFSPTYCTVQALHLKRVLLLCVTDCNIAGFYSEMAAVQQITEMIAVGKEVAH